LDFKVAFSPELNINAHDFVSAWNSTLDCAARAEARLENTAGVRYDPLIDGAVAVLSGIGIGVASNMIYDLIKRALSHQKVQKHTEIVQMTQPDGTQVLIVKIDEGERPCR
jgi:hypothetical protein